jgi:crotonobetainyl-CoA:carnitine CoA-transferase CaiB-like acyl-CoA transferase
MQLADMGATVLRIERREAADLGVRRPLKFNLLLRNRPSIALDLKDPDAIRLVLDLVAEADALIEGFRPGVTERLGLGPDTCLARNPKLVYGRMTGWGQTGPLAHAAGHDINYISLTGALRAIGRKDQPPSVPLALVGDFGGGAMFLAMGVLAALLNARATGQGQVVYAAIVDGAASLATASTAFRLPVSGTMRAAATSSTRARPSTMCTNAATASGSRSARSRRASTPTCCGGSTSTRQRSAGSSTRPHGSRQRRCTAACSEHARATLGARCSKARTSASRRFSRSKRQPGIRT